MGMHGAHMRHCRRWLCTAAVKNCTLIYLGRLTMNVPMHNGSEVHEGDKC